MFGGIETGRSDAAAKSVLTELKLLEKEQFQESVTTALLLSHTSFPLKPRCLEEKKL